MIEHVDEVESEPKVGLPNVSRFIDEGGGFRLGQASSDAQRVTCSAGFIGQRLLLTQSDDALVDV